MTSSRLKPVQARGLAVMTGLLAFALVATESRSQEIPVPQRLIQGLAIGVNPGTVVRKIAPWSPTLKMKRIPDGATYRLLVGDVITHVNGRRVRNASDIVQALQLKDGEAELWIFDPSDRSHQKFRCRTILRPY